jgi:hypothetical protein
MSKPTRYGRKGGDLEPLQDGQYVAWGDYAALKAKNERLRKAGDALAKELATAWSSTVSELDETAPIYQWLAAKEGRDAK